jgi:hypothetical protein
MKKTTYKHECNKTLNYNKYESTKQIAMENQYKKMHHIKRKYLFYGKKVALLCSHSLMLPCGGSKKRLIRTRIRNSHIFANHFEINIFQKNQPCKKDDDERKKNI